jgi:hypothetical protein
MNISQLNLTKVFYWPEKVFISSTYLVHNKKMNVHIMDSNSVIKKCLIQQRK